MIINNTKVLAKVNTSVACLSYGYQLDLFAMKYLSYGERLKAARKHKKLSQTKLADLSGVGQGSISKIERGDQEASAFDIDLAIVLGVSPLWLKTGDKTFEPEWIDGASSNTVNSDITELRPISKDISPGSNRIGIKHIAPRLQAGIVGFTFDLPIDDENEPIFFNQSWFIRNRYKASALFSCTVRGDSMYPKINEGDLVVINTEQRQPKDGVVFAVNYEGEFVIKRLKRDSGRWWLSSDNPDKTKHPDKMCEGDYCLIIGECIYLQTSNI